jgi:hypothetical protein
LGSIHPEQTRQIFADTPRWAFALKLLVCGSVRRHVRRETNFAVFAFIVSKKRNQLIVLFEAKPSDAFF